MNTNIQKLYKIGRKKSRLVVGLMSGTSLDGLDVAICKISGSGLSTKVTLQHFKTISYSSEIKNLIKEVFAKPNVDFLKLTELNAFIGELQGQVILKCLKQWRVVPNKIDLIASHGQTVFHSPKSSTPNAKRNSTLQIGDGDHLAAKTGIITMSDFRQKHIAHGGEGAPLAIYGDYLLFSKKGESRIMLNLGGIGNFTYLPPSGKASGVFVTDTGPSNTLLDQAAQQFFGLPFDKDSNLARQGRINDNLLNELKAHPFFQLSFPKTTGPELFNLGFIERAMTTSKTLDINLHDLMATLTRFSAETIVNAIRSKVKAKSLNVFMSGGGARNPLLCEQLQSLMPDANFSLSDELGIPADAKEAVLFAVLANEAVAGKPIAFNKKFKIPNVSFGKVSFPK